MKLVLLWALGCGAWVWATPLISPVEFEHWVQDYQTKNTKLSPSKKHRSAHYVFVAGFLNENNGRYFEDNLKYLITAGVSAENLHLISPSSSKSIDDGSVKLSADLEKIPGRLVIIAHSKGAEEVLAFAIRNPDFIEKRVQAIFLIQGSFWGSGVADHLLGKGIKMDHKMPFKDRLLFMSFSRSSGLWSSSVLAGLTSLATEASKLYWDKLLLEHRLNLSAIDAKIFYIRGSRSPANVAPFLQPTANYLHTYYGINDGLVLLKDQFVKEVGTILVDLDADHTDLTMVQPVSYTTGAIREALTAAIFTAVESIP